MTPEESVKQQLSDPILRAALAKQIAGDTEFKTAIVPILREDHEFKKQIKFRLLPWIVAAIALPIFISAAGVLLAMHHASTAGSWAAAAETSNKSAGASATAASSSATNAQTEASEAMTASEKAKTAASDAEQYRGIIESRMKGDPKKLEALKAAVDEWKVPQDITKLEWAHELQRLKALPGRIDWGNASVIVDASELEIADPKSRWWISKQTARTKVSFTQQFVRKPTVFLSVVSETFHSHDAKPLDYWVRVDSSDVDVVKGEFTIKTLFGSEDRNPPKNLPASIRVQWIALEPSEASPPSAMTQPSSSR